jgi:hypothetical protein
MRFGNLSYAIKKNSFTFEEKKKSVWEVIFKEKITSRRPELAARLTALAAKRMPLSLATAKPQPGAFHPVQKCLCSVSVSTCLLGRIRSPKQPPAAFLQPASPSSCSMTTSLVRCSRLTSTQARSSYQVFTSLT